MSETLEVDPKVYYQAATNCFDAAVALNDSFKYVFGELNSCGQMAGRDEDGRAWATSYDESARDAVAFFDQTFSTLRAYGTALNDLGFEHAKSDAVLKGTTQPERPQDPASTVTFGPYALPASAAGGTPQGLAKASIEVLDAINCPLPDGNTDTLTKAADAWDRLGTIYQNTNAKDKITIAASLFDGVKSDDAMQVREDLKTLETSIGALLNTCKQISKTCLDYKESIEELRNEIKGFIDAIIQEAAIDMAVMVIATCLTGVGGLIAGAKAVESARRWAVKIKGAVTAWRARKILQLKGLADDAKVALAKGKQAIKDLYERLRGKTDSSVKTRPGATLSQKDLDALADYTGPGYWDLNQALRNGTLDASQEARVRAIEEALSKLPNHNGTVYRGTDLPASVLDDYKPGEMVTEHAFTSTSSSPSTAFPGNTQFTIISKTGKDVSQYSSTEAAGIVESEVLFPPGVRFQVVSKTFDPGTGKTFIELIER
ncbi:ADP-ribosyltransferase [Nocardia altamirensis]|uniref:ADP-ribosyltransferase n=1 Tax=Nocardia altamirensis TaxID=472158 RepID=UPI0008402F70|nr:ADP-ribosyltransferase [Nocardia altamirensis]